MIGIVVVTHGRVAEELVNAARTIHGELPGIVAVPLGWGDDAAAASAAIERGIAEVGGEAALVLTDMFGGHADEPEPAVPVGARSRSSPA